MKKLQECTSLQEALPILRGKSATFRKTVETAFALMGNKNPDQQSLGHGFLATAIQEMDAAEQPTPHHDEGIKAKKEHFVKEEELSGSNKSGTEGSEQSSKNTQPNPKEGTEEPVGDLEQPEMSTENQMKEGFPPMGQPPGMSPPGLDPNIAQAMAPQMPQIPQMTTPQQIQQMQYTVKQYMETIVLPMRNQILKQNKAIKFLSEQIRESKVASMGLYINNAREQLRPIQESVMPQTVINGPGGQKGEVKIYQKQYDLDEKRKHILDRDKLL